MGAWRFMAASCFLVCLGATSTGVYCGRDTGHCTCGDDSACWPKTFWNHYGYDSGCEEDFKADWMRNPVNALSNVGFLMAGIVLATLAWEDRHTHNPNPKSNPLVANPVLTWMFAVCFTWVGVGSFLFHASSTRIGHHLDMIAVDDLLLCFLPYLCLRNFVNRIHHLVFVPLTMVITLILIGIPFMRLWEINWGSSV